MLHKLLCLLGIHKYLYVKADVFKVMPYCKYCDKILWKKP